MRHSNLLLLALAMNATPALAQDRPQTMPSRDVDILYQITRGPQSMQERTRWEAGELTQRVDPPDRNMHLIMDHKQHRAWLVDDSNHRIMDLEAPRPTPLDPGSTAAFTRRGTDTVAGLGCTEWATTSGGPETLLCLTDDGVLLRVQANGHTMIEANTVTYGPADPALFQLPADYKHMAPPPRRPPAGAAAPAPASGATAPPPG